METYYYFIITPEAKVLCVEIRSLEISHVSTRLPALEELQYVVGGYIETVKAADETLNCTPYQVIGIVNDEGRLKALADNPIASMVLHYPEPLVGNVVIAQVDGDEIVGFNEKEAGEISRRIYHTRNLYAGYFGSGGDAGHDHRCAAVRGCGREKKGVK